VKKQGRFDKILPNIVQSTMKIQLSKVAPMYALIEVDRAGNSVEVLQHKSFEYICEESVKAKRIRPQNLYFVINRDRIDIDWEDGLTDEEREMLP
jgi:hypothetical protein